MFQTLRRKRARQGNTCDSTSVMEATTTPALPPREINRERTDIVAAAGAVRGKSSWRLQRRKALCPMRLLFLPLRLIGLSFLIVILMVCFFYFCKPTGKTPMPRPKIVGIPAPKHSQLDSKNLQGQGQGQSAITSLSKITKTKSSYRIVYVHVGKTGGEFIKAQFPIICNIRKNKSVQQTCRNKFFSDSDTDAVTSLLGSAVKGYIHTRTIYPRNAIPLATHFLFSIRHPLQRLASWYVYNHPMSCDPRESNSPSCKTKNQILEEEEEESDAVTRPSSTFAGSTSFKTTPGQSSSSRWLVAFFRDCFPTFDQLEQVLLSSKSWSTVSDSQSVSTLSNGINKNKHNNLNIDDDDPSIISCQRILQQGSFSIFPSSSSSFSPVKIPNIDVKDPNHFYWNYQYYWNITKMTSSSSSSSTTKNSHHTKNDMFSKRILVIRQEFLMQDLQNLENYLHRTQQEPNNNDTNHNSNANNYGDIIDHVPMKVEKREDRPQITSSPPLNIFPADTNHFTTGKVFASYNFQLHRRHLNNGMKQRQEQQEEAKDIANDNQQDAGGRGRPNKEISERHDNDGNQEHNYVSSSPTLLSICCHPIFIDEVQIYLTMIQRAENLTPIQRDESIQSALFECGLDVKNPGKDLLFTSPLTHTTLMTMSPNHRGTAPFSELGGTIDMKTFCTV